MSVFLQGFLSAGLHLHLGGHPRLPYLLAGAVEVDIAPSLVLVQLGVLALLLVALQPLLFQPLMNLFDEREKRVEGARAEARKMDDDAADMLRKYDAEIDKVNRAATSEREKIRLEAAKAEASMLAETRAEVAAMLEKGRLAIATETAAARETLAPESAAIARQMASAVLGREVS